MIRRIGNYVKRVIVFLGNIEIYQRSISMTEKLSREILWRNIFIDTVRGYDWYKVDSISLGRWAIGYNFAYVLARALESARPSKILEMGLGQSSKIINSFCANTDTVKVYDIVEQDNSWIDFFKMTGIADCVKIHQKDIISENGTYVYDKFREVINGKRYSLISIDGPWGGKEISRIDILEYIPMCLEKEFVILVDDYNRRGEKKMVSKLEEKLKTAGIDYFTGSYQSESDMCIIVSEKYKFLTSV